PPQYQPEPIDCSSPVATILLDSTYCSLLALLVENVANICYRVHQGFAAELRPPCELGPLRVACWACQLVQYECQQPLDPVCLLLIHFATPVALWRLRCRRFSQLIVETLRLRHVRVVILPARPQVVRARSRAAGLHIVETHILPGDRPAELVIHANSCYQVRALLAGLLTDRPILRRPAVVGVLDSDGALIRQRVRVSPRGVPVPHQLADVPRPADRVVRGRGAGLPPLPALIGVTNAAHVVDGDVLDFLSTTTRCEVFVN